MRFALSFLSLLLLSFSPFVFADADDSKKVALVGGTLIDGLGSKPIYDSVILIEGNTILATGTQTELKVPSDYEVISTEGNIGMWPILID